MLRSVPTLQISPSPLSAPRKGLRAVNRGSRSPLTVAEARPQTEGKDRRSFEDFRYAVLASPVVSTLLLPLAARAAEEDLDDELFLSAAQQDPLITFGFYTAVAFLFVLTGGVAYLSFCQVRGTLSQVSRGR
jgi:hypothetical protein